MSCTQEHRAHVRNTFAILVFGVLSLGQWIPLKVSLHPLLPGCASRCFSLCALLLESASIRALPPACAVLRCTILTCAVRGRRPRCHMIFNWAPVLLLLGQLIPHALLMALRCQ